MSRDIFSLGQRIKFLLKRKKFEREFKNFYLDLLERGSFKASEKNRTNANWTTGYRHINTILRGELTTMRDRSRWLIRNNPHAQAVVATLVSYLVGTGLEPQGTVVKKGTDILDDPWNDKAEKLFRYWARDCDVSSSASTPESFFSVQRMLVRKFAEDGEIFIHRVVDLKNKTVPFRFEILEPECIDANKTSHGDNDVVMGVELYKKTTKPVAYWVRDSDNNTNRIDAKYINHIFERQYQGQVRGIPQLSAVMSKFFDLDEFLTAELTSAKIAACFSVFIKLAEGMQPGGDMLPGGASTQASDSDGNLLSHVQPGIIATLPKNAEISFAQPQKPSTTFAMFTEYILRTAGAGVFGGMSYEAMTRDTSKSTFAGGRLAQQMDYQNFSASRKLLIQKFFVPTWRFFVDMAILANKLNDPDITEPESRYAHEWIAPGWSLGINPAQEANAAVTRMRAGITTLADECIYSGRDWYSQLRLMSKIKREADALGLNLISDGSHSTVNGVEEKTEGQSNENESNQVDEN